MLNMLSSVFNHEASVLICGSSVLICESSGLICEASGLIRDLFKNFVIASTVDLELVFYVLGKGMNRSINTEAR